MVHAPVSGKNNNLPSVGSGIFPQDWILVMHHGYAVTIL
jgi:hypothetical protein